MAEELLPTRHGGYRQLDTFMLATILYYGTVSFCKKHISSVRQVDQMVQAARSGRQNIAEGSERSVTSAQTEIALTDVARASLAELQLDYEDFIHFQGEDPWMDDAADSVAIRTVRLTRVPLGKDVVHNFSKTVRSETSKFAHWLNADNPVTVANAMIRLCDRTDFLLRRQLEALGNAFLENGGFKERMTRCRNAFREGQNEQVTPVPDCPKCSSPMRVREIRKGARAGQRFWGCTKYPACDGAREWEEG